MSTDQGAGPGSIRPSGNLFHEVRTAAASSAAPGNAAPPTGDAAIRADERARCFTILASAYTPGREVEALRLALFTDIPASQATFAMGSVPTSHRRGMLTPPAGYAGHTAANAAAAAAHDPTSAAPAARGSVDDLAAAVTAEVGRAGRAPSDADAGDDLASAVTAEGGRGRA